MSVQQLDKIAKFPVDFPVSMKWGKAWHSVSGISYPHVRNGDTENGWIACEANVSVRHQNRQSHRREDTARHAAEDEFANAGMAVAAHDE